MSGQVPVQKMLSVMGGVMGVDEDGLGLTVVVVLVVVLLGLPGRIVLGGVLTSGGDVVALEDPESIDTSRVLHSDGLASVVDVAVLSNPLVVASRLLSKHNSIFLCVCCSKLSSTSVKSLLLQDDGVAGVALELRS